MYDKTDECDPLDVEMIILFVFVFVIFDAPLVELIIEICLLLLFLYKYYLIKQCISLVLHDSDQVKMVTTRKGVYGLDNLVFGF